MGSRDSGKPKYSADVHAEIVRYLKAGAFKTHAAQAAGVSISALESWLTKGREGVEPYVQLARDVEQAIATDAVRNQAIISQAAQGRISGDWKAAAWNLEKKHPKLYGSAAREVRELEARERERPFSPFKQQHEQARKHLDS